MSETIELLILLLLYGLFWAAWPLWMLHKAGINCRLITKNVGDVYGLLEESRGIRRELSAEIKRLRKNQCRSFLVTDGNRQGWCYSCDHFDIHWADGAVQLGVVDLANIGVYKVLAATESKEEELSNGIT